MDASDAQGRAKTIAPAQARRKGVAKSFWRLLGLRKKPGKERLSFCSAQPVFAPALDKLT